jgi:SAM-dependent methyltransferase
MENKFEIPVNWLVCPETKKTLVADGETLKSESGNYRKDKTYGFWNFIPARLKLFDEGRWASWNVLQENATVPYKDFPERNLGVGPRVDFLQFADFCKFKGNVLDIGVGPQKCPTHIQYNKIPGVFFVGVDPLVGQQPREFAYVQSLGEYLPFRNHLFDQVLFVTSLDHFIDPRVALSEAARVTKADGEICVWLGEKDKNAPKPAESPEWYKKLRIPEGAEDPFHFKRFSIDEFKQYVLEAGLCITEEEIHVVDEWRKNCFYKLKIKA